MTSNNFKIDLPITKFTKLSDASCIDIKILPEGLEIISPFDLYDHYFQDALKQRLHPIKRFIERAVLKAVMVQECKEMIADFASKLSVISTPELKILAPQEMTELALAYFDPDTNCICIDSRLMNAPRHVFEYLTAHEVCHKIIDDHNEDFWALYKYLVSEDTIRSAQGWLNENLHNFADLPLDMAFYHQEEVYSIIFSK